MTAATDRRARDLARLTDETWDILIVGGGIVGCGALLDAASRGLRVALIEQGDIASGTSSRSSRLIHGGLRYLEQLRIPLVREALAERRRLLRLAPHLVSLQPLLFPIFGTPFLSKAFYDAGLTLYDILGSRHDGGWHRRLSAADTMAIAPSLRRDGLRGGLLFHDGMEDDAQFTLAVLRTALARAEAPVAVTRVRATGHLAATGPADPHVVRAKDLADGRAIDIRADAVIDATGVWAAESSHPFRTQRAADVADPDIRILPSRGAHLVVPRARINSATGMTIRVPGKIVFLVPWPDHWLIGTTDAPFDGPAARPTAATWEVDELLAAVNRSLDVGLTRDDVVGTYAGLRPLVGAADGPTVKASREHRVTTGPTGIVRIGGGKYTTYRVMARDVVDAALRRAGAHARPSATADLRLIGAADRTQLEQVAAEIATIPMVSAIHPEAAVRLVTRHGTQAPAVVALGGELDLLRPLIFGRPFLEAEVAWAARHELAHSLDDVLARRLRVAMEEPDRGAAIAPRVAEILGAELGWGASRQALEVETYLATARREYGIPGGDSARP